MSVKSLASEVKPRLALTQVIKAADQLYNKDRRLYTQIKPEYSSAATKEEINATESHLQQESRKGGGKRRQQKASGGEHQNSEGSAENGSKQSQLKQTIEAAKKTVNEALNSSRTFSGGSSSNDQTAEVEVLRREVESLKIENREIRKELADIRQKFIDAPVPSAITSGTATNNKDDDFDLFASNDEAEEDEESEEQKRVREERLAAYAAKKAKKPGPIAKSSVILDVKPWDDETNMEEMERCVRSLEMDGLLWGAAKLLPIGYGIRKLQIVCTIEDEKVSVDTDLIERIQDEFSDHVQSVDIAAFNKI